jgi:hypothetical protein
VCDVVADCRSTDRVTMKQSVANATAEGRFLLLMAGGPENDAPLAERATSGLDWQRLAALAERENAYPVFWQRLARISGVNVPSDLAEAMRKRSLVAQFTLLNQGRLLEKTVGALNAAGIDSILLKGAGLAAGVYKSFIERPMGDIDLLVRPEQALAARDTLLGAGWEQQGNLNLTEFYAGHHHLEPFYDAKGSGASLELHTDILSPGHPFELGLPAWWERRQRVVVGKQIGHSPSPEHQMLHVCVHFAWANGLNSSSWNAMRDVAALIREGRIDWAEFTRLAAAARAETCAYWTLAFARTLAGVPVPDEAFSTRESRKSKWMHALILRNFLLSFSGSGLACPSTRARRAIWEATIDPEASGHGAIRPWSRDHLFRTGATPPEVERTWRFEAWRKYIAAVLRTKHDVRAFV